jgi:AraC family transcriptional regulator, arabinose operon regulatory protein
MDYQMKKMDNPMAQDNGILVILSNNRMSRAGNMDDLRRAEGFPGQIMHVIPRPTLQRMGRHFLLSALCVTDIGWYPRARHHFRERPDGADQHILIFCVRGTGWFEIGGRRAVVTPHHALLIPRGVPHAYGASPTDPWSIHWIHFIGDEADYYARLLPDGVFQLPVSTTCVHAMERTFRDSYASLTGGYLVRNLVYLAHALRHLLGLLFYGNRAYSPELRAPPTRDLQGTIDFMVEHLAEPLRLADMGRHAGLSAVHFASLFRRQTGMAPIEYFIHLRIRHACRLLDTTGLTIREIGYRVGYEDPYYFSRTFRKLMGLSPRKYRELRKG